MTGFGLAKQEDNQRRISVEIKTLNSKFLDTGIRLPKFFASKELEVKNLVTESLERGKISLVIEYASVSEENAPIEFNKSLFKAYYQQLTDLAKEVNSSSNDLFKIALTYPDVQIQNYDEEILEEEWEVLKKVLANALKKCDEFRISEGKELEKRFIDYINNIESYLEETEKHDPKRLGELKDRLKKSLEDLSLNGEIDKNRFEQELIYYIEKLDISEEKVRLKNHLDYFREVMNAKNSQGKKLNFISQEIGREINTLGSKANYAPIQKLVVNMKDELEKIKEQIQNIV